MDTALATTTHPVAATSCSHSLTDLPDQRPRRGRNYRADAPAAQQQHASGRRMRSLRDLPPAKAVTTAGACVSSFVLAGSSMLIFVSPATRHSLVWYPRCLPCSCPAMPAAGYGQGRRAHRSCRCACGHSSGNATRCSDHDGDHSSRAGLVKAKAQQLAEGSSGSSSLTTDLCLAAQL